MGGQWWCVSGCVTSAGCLRERARDPPGGRMRGEVGWWRRVAGDPEQAPSWQSKLEGTEHAGAWLAGCTCYPTGMTGRL